MQFFLLPNHGEIVQSNKCLFSWEEPFGPVAAQTVFFSLQGTTLSCCVCAVLTSRAPRSRRTAPNSWRPPRISPKRMCPISTWETRAKKVRDEERPRQLDEEGLELGYSCWRRQTVNVRFDAVMMTLPCNEGSSRRALSCRVDTAELHCCEDTYEILRKKRIKNLNKNRN